MFGLDYTLEVSNNKATVGIPVSKMRKGLRKGVVGRVSKWTVRIESLEVSLQVWLNADAFFNVEDFSAGHFLYELGAMGHHIYLSDDGYFESDSSLVSWAHVELLRQATGLFAFTYFLVPVVMIADSVLKGLDGAQIASPRSVPIEDTKKHVFSSALAEIWIFKIGPVCVVVSVRGWQEGFVVQLKGHFALSQSLEKWRRPVSQIEREVEVRQSRNSQASEREMGRIPFAVADAFVRPM